MSIAFFIYLHIWSNFNDPTIARNKLLAFEWNAARISMYRSLKSTGSHAQRNDEIYHNNILKVKTGFCNYILLKESFNFDRRIFTKHISTF